MNKIFKDVAIFSKGKKKNVTEDNYYFDNNALIVVDGATDKSGIKYNGKSGGQIISSLIVNEIAKRAKHSNKIEHYLSEKISHLYKDLNIDVNDKTKIFSSTMVLVQKHKDKIHITQIGDTSFRINGIDVFTNDKIIDYITGILRKHYIKVFGEQNMEEARKFIFPILSRQFIFQNNEKDFILNEENFDILISFIRDHYNGYSNNIKLIEKIFQLTKKDLEQYFNQNISYGIIDGTKIPEKYIKKYTFDINDISLIEIFTDGYYKIPKIPNIDEWEKEYGKGEKEDPYKYKKYISTKPIDDRTVMIAKLST